MVRKFKMADWQKSLIIAQSDVQIDETRHPINTMYGCGLPEFEPVVVTHELVARHIRWQAQFMDGTWDIEELENCKHIARNKFRIEE